MASACKKHVPNILSLDGNFFSAEGWYGGRDGRKRTQLEPLRSHFGYVVSPVGSGETVDRMEDLLAQIQRDEEQVCRKEEKGVVGLGREGESWVQGE